MDSNTLILVIFLILMIVGFGLIAGLMMIDIGNSSMCVVGGC